MPNEAPAPAARAAAPACERCGKPGSVCVCDRLVPMRSKIEVVILQHPQEPDKVLGTARLTALSLPESARVKVGLSWASLSHALGREARNERWAVLYRGSLPKDPTPEQLAKPVLVLDRHGEERDTTREPLEGIIVLDGTWSQAKTLWWRNAWMLKLNRLLLNPREPSLYGKLRKEPRREALSTIEAVAEALDGLGEAPELRAQLKRIFRTMLQRARDAQRAEQVAHPSPRRAGRGARRSAPRGRGGGPLD